MRIFKKIYIYKPLCELLKQLAKANRVQLSIRAVLNAGICFERCIQLPEKSFISPTLELSFLRVHKTASKKPATTVKVDWSRILKRKPNFNW